MQKSPPLREFCKSTFSPLLLFFLRQSQLFFYPVGSISVIKYFRYPFSFFLFLQQFEITPVGIA